MRRSTKKNQRGQKTCPNEKRGQKIETHESEASPQRLTKDGQKEHEPLPDMPEMTGRPNAEKPKERKDDVELPDMPKF